MKATEFVENRKVSLYDKVGGILLDHHFHVSKRYSNEAKNINEIHGKGLSWLQIIILVLVLADVAFVSAEMVYYDKKTDFTECCRPNDKFRISETIEKLDFNALTPYEHQNSTEYCIEEEKYYGKYKKLSKIFHCCSCAVLSIMMVEELVEIFPPPY